MSDFQDRIANLPPKRLALLAIELQAKLERLEQRSVEPIAIIGMGCRFPGGATGPDAFWEVLRNGVDAISEVPRDRWNIDEYYDPEPGAPGKMSTRYGGFVDAIDQFDPLFFGITPREAASMDPQQRLLLEVTWEALEHAAQNPDRLAGSPTGVFVGIAGIDFAQILLASDSAKRDIYTASGASHAIAAGRIAYVLGLHGPCLSMDTACSSSLVAVHVACQSLRAGECTLALAGGANAILTPDTTVSLSKAGMMAPDGRCKSFDAGANGFVRGEGCGVVVLKRLSDARADGDRILALIRGSAINQDGRSSGITAPNGPAQEAVIREALGRAGVRPAEIQYVETHGTGTVLGDPIEARALGAVLRDGRPKDRPLLVGSVKSNFGHLEAAAGVAGLIKVVLALTHQEIPKSLHLVHRNPYIEWDDLLLAVSEQGSPWPRGGAPRLAGISSLGFSGTNAHVIVEEAPPNPVTALAADRPLHVLTLSARSEKALDTLVERYRADLETGDQRPLGDICFTANVGRAHFPHRCAIVASGREDLVQKLGEARAGTLADSVARGRAEGGDPPQVAFLFSGQGSQYPGMGRDLFETQPAFRTALLQCEEILREPLGLGLTSILYPSEGERQTEGLLDQTGYTQPALFALEYALAQLWRSWGIVPSAVMGHSVGEYVAACVAGVFSLEDGLKMIAARARLMQGLPSGGAMTALFCDHERALDAIARYAPTISVAAVNGPAHVVISGPEREVAEVAERLRETGVETRPLRVSHAFHSALMDPMLAAFEDVAASVRYGVPGIDVISNLTGGPISAEEIGTASYWRRHVRQPVLFAKGVAALHDTGVRTFVEVGPAPVLLGMGRSCLAGDESRWLPSLKKNLSGWNQMLRSLSALYVSGADVDWVGFDRDYGRRKVSLPTYPFQRSRHWPDVPSRPAAVAPSASPAWRNWLFEQVWAEAEGPKEGAGSFRPTRDIAARTGQDALAVVEANHGSEYQRLKPKFDALCAAYVVRALRHLGLAHARGTRLQSKGLRESLGVIDRHARLFERMLEMLTEDALLEPIDGGWRVGNFSDVPDTDVLAPALLAEFPMCEAELSLASACGSVLPEILRGSRDPMDVLFPSGSLEQTDKLYGSSPASRIFNTLVARAVVAAVEALPRERPLRILEVGAGTGSTSKYVLEILAGRHVEYTFTDISGFFLSKARQKFRSYSFVQYKVFDAEIDPEQQGFAPGTFDLVIASNALHATADLRTSLGNVQKLLAPMGLLVLLEGTSKPRFGDLTVGLTEGWWRFTDTDLRSYALMAPDRWVSLLEDLGFTESVAFPEYEGDPGHPLANQSIVLARAPKQSRRVMAPPMASPRSWLVLADSGGVGVQVAAALRARNAQVMVVEKSETFATTPNGFAVNPDNAEDMHRLVRETAASHRELGVVHLWSLDETTSDEDSTESVHAAVKHACGSALYIAQAIAETSLPTPPRLVLVTRGAQATGVGYVQPVHATVSSLGRVIALEHPELQCTTVDLDSADAESDIHTLLEVLIVAPVDRQLALRAGHTLVPQIRLKSFDSAAVSRFELRPDATYLVTGGLAGLGWLTAEWLVARGARHLVLMGRREPSPAVREAVARLEQSGVSIRMVLGDVSKGEDVRRALDEAPTSAPLRGVIHSAGVTDDASLLQQDWSRFERVMAAKVDGAWLLHRLCEHVALDFFVLFSSGASFVGSPGQANHAAANAFMDALAHRRRAAGHPALSVNWGPWSGSGAATRGDILERVHARGIGSIDPASGLQVLEHLLQTASAQIAVLPIEDPELLSRAGLRTVHGAMSTNASEPERPESSTHLDLLGDLRHLPAGQLKAVLVERIERAAIRVMGIDASESLDPQQPLNELGLDSLMAVELRNALEAVVVKPLPATLLFNYPTIAQLAEHLTAILAPDEAPEAVAHRIPAAALPLAASDSHLDELSEDELALLLAGKLRTP
jgi:microcystin synthetase protein McyG